MERANPLNTLFSGKRVYIIIGLFLIVSSFLVYRSFTEVKYVPTKEKGTHTWIDTNKDGVIQSFEMLSDSNGNYQQINATSVFSEIELTNSTLLWIIVALIFVVFRDLAYMNRVRLFTDGSLTFKRSFITIMLWEFASALTPGVVGGSAVALFILNKEGISMAKSTAIVMLSTLMDNLFFVIMIPVVLSIISINTMFGEEAIWMTSIFWIGYTIITSLSILLFLAVIVYPKLIGNTLLAITKLKWFKRWKNSAETFSKEIIVTASIMKKKELVFWLKTFGATVLAWISRYLIINALVMAFISLNALQHIVLLGKQLILWLLMLVSPTPGASGIAEFAFSELLRPFSDSLLLLTCIALLWRLLSYFPYLFIGAIILPKWLKTKK